MGLTRAAQIGISVESVEGTEESLVAADYSGNRKDSGHRYSTGEYDRELQRGTLTKQRPLRSMQRLAIQWTEEFVGGDASNQALIHETIQGLGFEALGLKKVTTTGAPSADGFQVGDVFGDNASQGSATATGIVAAVRIDGAGPGRRIWYLPTLGTFGGSETLTNYTRTGGATLTASAAADGGFRFKPLSERDASIPASCTVQRRIAGQLHSAVASRGTGGLSMRQEEPALLRAEFEGVPIFDPAGANDHTPRAGTFLTSVPQITDPPKMTQGIPFILRTGDVSDDFAEAVLTELDITIGNTLAPRPTISDAALHSSGYLGTRISDREISARIDPEHVLPTDFDFIGHLIDGDTFELIAELGDAFGPNGLLVVYGGRVQMTGDYEPGDRDGIVTSPVTVGFFGDDDDELIINHCFDS